MLRRRFDTRHGFEEEGNSIQIMDSGPAGRGRRPRKTLWEKSDVASRAARHAFVAGRFHGGL